MAYAAGRGTLGLWPKDPESNYRMIPGTNWGVSGSGRIYRIEGSWVDGNFQGSRRATGRAGYIGPRSTNGDIRRVTRATSTLTYAGEPVRTKHDLMMAQAWDRFHRSSTGITARGDRTNDWKWLRLFGVLPNTWTSLAWFSALSTTEMQRDHPQIRQWTSTLYEYRKGCLGTDPMLTRKLPDTPWTRNTGGLFSIGVRDLLAFARAGMFAVGGCPLPAAPVSSHPDDYSGPFPPQITGSAPGLTSEPEAPDPGREPGVYLDPEHPEEGEETTEVQPTDVAPPYAPPCLPCDGRELVGGEVRCIPAEGCEGERPPEPPECWVGVDPEPPHGDVYDSACLDALEAENGEPPPTGDGEPTDNGDGTVTVPPEPPSGPPANGGANGAPAVAAGRRIGWLPLAAAGGVFALLMMDGERER